MILCYITLDYIIFYCTIFYYIRLDYITLYYTISYCLILYYIILHCIILYIIFLFLSARASLQAAATAPGSGKAPEDTGAPAE